MTILNNQITQWTSRTKMLGIFGCMCDCLLQSCLGSCHQLLPELGTWARKVSSLHGVTVLRQS